MKTLGLIYAMPAELESLLARVGKNLIKEVAGIPFYRLSPQIIVCPGGVGKVNIAMAAQLMIDEFHPDCLLNAGVAGCMTELSPGSIVLAESFCQHDMDTSAIGDPVGFVSTVNRTYFPASHCELCRRLLTRQGVSFSTGRVASGDWFAVDSPRAEKIRELLSPLLCDMESCSIAQVCLRNRVDFVSIKSVSDHVFTGDKSDLEFHFNFHAAMESLNAIVYPFALALAEALSEKSAALSGMDEESAVMQEPAAHSEGDVAPAALDRIASFSVNHDVLVPGLYLSRRDGTVTTYDLRFKKPNTGDLLSNAQMHSVEHLIATLLRNSAAKDAILYFGPMGCQTGFYFLFNSALLPDADAITLLAEVFRQAADYDGSMPGASAPECGNYINLDLALAREACRFYADLIGDWTPERLIYPV